MFNVAGTISILSIIPALIIAVLKFKNAKQFWPFCLLIILGSGVDFFSFIAQNVLTIPNFNSLWIINIFVIIQFYLIIYQFYVWGLFKLKIYPIITAIGLITALWIWESISNKWSNDLDGYTLIFSSFFIVIFATIFVNTLIFEKIIYLTKDPRFLINVGLLIYFTTNMLVFIFVTPQFKLSGIYFLRIWIVHDIINTFTNLIYAGGLLCIRKR